MQALRSVSIVAQADKLGSHVRKVQAEGTYWAAELCKQFNDCG